MRWVAFDSKDFKREKKIEGKGSELIFFTPLGVGVAFDDPEEFSVLTSKPPQSCLNNSVLKG